jgi:DNA-binding beta-propeller fold protein YncE
MTLKPAALALIAVALLSPAGCGSGSSGRRPSGGRQSVKPDPRKESTRSRLGLPRITGDSLLPGYLMIADRDNNRIIVVSPAKRVVWRFPRRGDLRRGQRFGGPDDAFVTPDGRSIITNEEYSDTIARIRVGRRPRISWQYGHPGAQGSSHGYLAHPDDAYLLRNGETSVADIINCRVLWLSQAKRIVRSIGNAGACTHDPPRSLRQPNGDTPLPDGGVLVTEIGGWVDRFDRHGHLKWSLRTPTAYPSDAQLLRDGNVLVAGFNTPGRVDILTPRGRVIWSYRQASGRGALDRPSLAVMLPNGVIAVTDDWHHRVVLIDRKTRRIVWQYGHLGAAGARPGYLNKPDGLDLIR